MVLEHEFPPDVRVEKEASSLLEAGHEVYLASASRKGASKEKKLKRIHIFQKKISSFTYKSSIGCLNFPFYFTFWRRFLHSLFEKYQFDVIHIHDLPLVKIGIEIKEKYKIKLVVDLHENYPALLEEAQHTNSFPGNLFFSSKQWREYEKNSLIKADAIIVVVKEMKDRIVQLGIPPQRIFIVENTPDFKEIPPYDAPKDTDTIRLIYVGGVTKNRGLQIALKGLSYVVSKYPNIVLDIYGTGRYLKALQKFSRKIKIEKHVSFHGAITQEKVFSAISKAHIALIPHLRSEQTDNSSPNKLFQYLAMGKYILASDCKSIKRIVQESNCGLVYKDASPEDFSIKLSEIIEQNTYISPCINGLKIISDKYNWQITSRNLVELYNHL